MRDVYVHPSLLKVDASNIQKNCDVIHPADISLFYSSRTWAVPCSPTSFWQFITLVLTAAALEIRVDVRHYECSWTIGRKQTKCSFYIAMLGYIVNYYKIIIIIGKLSLLYFYNDKSLRIDTIETLYRGRLCYKRPIGKSVIIYYLDLGLLF